MDENVHGIYSKAKIYAAKNDIIFKKLFILGFSEVITIKSCEGA